MNHCKLQKLVDWISRDNTAGLNIYNSLLEEYVSFNKSFENDINLFKVFFFDILKLLTQSLYKKYELDDSLQPTNRDLLGRIKDWPYFGYADLIYGTDPDTKTYGKDISFTQKRRDLFLASLHNSLLRKSSNLSSVAILATSPRLDSENSLLFSGSDFRVNLIRSSKNWFGVDNRERQLEILIDVVSRAAHRCLHPVGKETMIEVISRHIRANTRQGTSNIALDGDVVVISSGIELKNRMLAAVAKARGLKVVSVLHGEAAGVHDEPVFSCMGDTAYADAILGYGSKLSDSSIYYRWPFSDNSIYLESSSSRALGMYTGKYSGVSIQKPDISYYYFPTTLSGSSHRYGPYRDLPDALYLEWQRELALLFGGKIYVKSHPKEKYLEDECCRHSIRARGTIEDLIEKIDVFVFDYVSTAFHVACASTKPIVFFDLGIRNFQINALEEIKKRVVYIDVRRGIPTIAKIDSMVRFGTRENCYSKLYSLGPLRDRTRSLVQGLAGMGMNTRDR